MEEGVRARGQQGGRQGGDRDAFRLEAIKPALTTRAWSARARRLLVRRCRQVVARCKHDVIVCAFWLLTARDVEVVALVRREESKGELEAIKGVKAVLGLPFPPHPQTEQVVRGERRCW